MPSWVPPGSSPPSLLLIVLTPGTGTTRGQWGRLVPSEEVVKVQCITYDAQEKGDSGDRGTSRRDWSVLGRHPGTGCSLCTEHFISMQ